MAEKCDKCGGETTKGRHHKMCRACVNCKECGWSNTHNMMFKDWRTPSGHSMGYGAESFSAEVGMCKTCGEHEESGYCDSCDSCYGICECDDCDCYTCKGAESFGAEVCPCGCAMKGCVCSSSCKGECLGAESFGAETFDTEEKENERHTVNELLGKEVKIFPSDSYSKFGIIEQINENGVLFKITRTPSYSEPRDWSKTDAHTWLVGTLVWYSWKNLVFRTVPTDNKDAETFSAESPTENNAESFEAEGNPKKTTSTLYARFYVGHTDKKGELAGNGKFKSYDDALAKAKEVAKKEGHSRIVSTRGFALWTSDGQGLFQAGKINRRGKEILSG